MENKELLENPEEIKINDDQALIQILGRPPGWILYWGITVVFFVFSMLLLIGYLIKFPDVIPTRVVLTTENPPVRVFTRVDGKLQELLVKDKDAIKAGELLAVIENTAERADILRLENFLESIDLDLKSTSGLDVPRGLNLGNIQTSFASFIKRFDEYRFFLSENTIERKIQSLNNQISHLHSLNESLEKQEKTLYQVVEIAERNFTRNQELLKNDLASKVEVEDAETTYLQRKQELERLSTQLINNNMETEGLKLRIIEFREGRTEENFSQDLGIKEKLEQLKSEVEIWKQKYLITAPIGGKISMPNIWSSQKFLKANEELLAIVPSDNAGKILGKAILPLAGSGKVELGMPVNIRLDGYPYQEFGAIEAKVKSISLVPENGQYQLELHVPDTLITTYRKKISFRQEMEGTGNIITKDRRILERIFDRLLSIVRND